MSGKLSILMYPWFAMGHFIPYLSTANKLAHRGHKIFLITPPNAPSKLDPLNLYPDLIQFIPVSIPPVDGLPENLETTNGTVSFQEKQLLRYALDLTEPVLRSLLCDLRPDFVFYDLVHWLPDLARDLQIKSVHYSILSPAAVSFLFAEFDDRENLFFPDGFTPSIELDKHSTRGLKFMGTTKEIGSGITMKERLISSLSHSDAIGFRTCDEIDGDYCRFLENRLKKPILLAGPVVPDPQFSSPLDERWSDWLNKFAPKSVIFCAFGSEAVLKRDQFEQLLLGIEQTGFPFLIALRPPLGFNTSEEGLPDGFADRCGDRGVVHGGWVPQQAILNHPAVGCFVTHCGSGSMWEGLMSESQLVALPHAGEHHVHARLLSGVVKVAVEVEKGDEDGVFSKEGVHDAVMAAMGQNGEQIKVNHDKLRELILAEGFDDSYFDSFLHNLQTLGTV